MDRYRMARGRGMEEITLTIIEIADLAMFAGLEIDIESLNEIKPDDEISIIQFNDGNSPRAYWTDYPEEGSVELAPDGKGVEI